MDDKKKMSFREIESEYHGHTCNPDPDGVCGICQEWSDMLNESDSEVIKTEQRNVVSTIKHKENEI